MIITSALSINAVRSQYEKFCSKLKSSNPVIKKQHISKAF
jgi:CMP-N-acetylneuraminic acid synthetase